MTAEQPADAERALDRHEAFEPSAEEFAVVTTPLEATVRAEPPEQEGRDAIFEVCVEAPTIDATAADSVADVVVDDWFTMFRRRLLDAPDAVEADPIDEPTIERAGDRVVVTVRLQAWTAQAGVDDAKAIVDYVEGTYVQGVIPGYEYEEPVAGLVARATDTGNEDDARRGGTPL